MVEHNTINAKLSHSKLNKLKRNNFKNEWQMFSGNDLPHELLLTTRRTTKLRNATENNMSADT